MTRLPVSLQSLIIQCVALLLTGGLAYLGPLVFAFEPAGWQLALAQGGIAALLSYRIHQPVWWQPLHFGFFPGILLAQQVDIAAWIYLLAFISLVSVYWSTFRTRVPLYLSDHKAWQAIVPLMPSLQTFRFIDLGSGLGDVPFFLESRFPRAHFFGTEIAPAPWLVSRLRAWFKRSRVRFMRRDYAVLDLAGFDVVFAFLSPVAMPALWQQAQAQMQTGSLFISLSFCVLGRNPDQKIELAQGARHTLYVWKM